MITEDYVSLEIAKLLKDKGFVVPYDSFRGVYINGEFLRRNPGQGYFFNVDDEIVDVCSLQMAMKWLREKHNLHIGMLITYQYFPRKYEIHIMHTEKYEDIIVNPGTNFNTNEEACEAGIKYCLENLI